MYKHIEPKVTRRAMTNNHHSIQEVNEIPVNIYTVHFSKNYKGFSNSEGSGKPNMIRGGQYFSRI